jgi:hypothetical protein
MPEGMVPWVENYSLGASPLPPELRLERLNWTHLPADRAMIALMKLGVAATDETVGQLGSHLLARSAEPSRWRIPTISADAPSWAMMEAAHALDMYASRLREAAHLAAVRDVLSLVVQRISAVEARSDEQEDQIRAIQVRTKPGFVATIARSVSRRLLSSKLFVASVITALLFSIWLAVAGVRDILIFLLAAIPVAAVGANALFHRDKQLTD